MKTILSNGMAAALSFCLAFSVFAASAAQERPRRLLGASMETSRVCVGDEVWDVSDEELSLPHRYACGAVLSSAVGRMRLDLSNAVVGDGGVYADGDIDLRLSNTTILDAGIWAMGDIGMTLQGDNYVSGSIRAGLLTMYRRDVSISGPGSLVLCNDLDGSAICGNDVSIIAAAAVTIVHEFDDYCSINADNLLISLSTVVAHSCGGGIAAASKIDILGAVVTVDSLFDGLSTLGCCGTVVIDGSIVSVLMNIPDEVNISTDFLGLVSCTHSYFSCVNTSGVALNADEVYFDNSLVKLYSKTTDALDANCVVFKEGDYYAVSGSGDYACAIGSTNVIVNGGNVHVCAPGEGSTCIDTCIFQVDAGMVEVVDQVDVSEFLKYDAAAAAALTGASAAGKFDAAGLMANFYSEVILDVISNLKIGKLEGSPHIGILFERYRQAEGTVWCDLPTFDFVAWEIPVIAGGSCKGQFFDVGSLSDGVYEEISPVVDGNNMTLKCLSYVVPGAKKYDKVSQSWDGMLPSGYGTGSLYADDEGKLYFWVPESWEFKEENPVDPPEPPKPVDPFTAAGLAPSYTLQAGVAPDLSKVFAAVAGGGWKIDVSGLPSGLKFAQDKKTGDYALAGVATKEVVSEVTFTATKGTEKETAKSTFEVVYPALTVVAVPGKDDPSATNGVKVVGGGRYALGAKVTLKATPAKTSVFMGWFLGEELVSQNASYAYVTTAEDATFTAKFITVGEDKSNISLSVNGAAIESAETPMATNVMCGVALEWPVAAGALSATTVKVAGLPAGLKFTDKPVTAKVGTGAAATVVTNVPANTIYGAPSAASKVDKNKGVVPSDVKITVTTAGKSSVTYLVKLAVDPLPAWAVGNFEGVAGDGSATMGVAASGKVSGKIALMGTNWTFKADSFAKEARPSAPRTSS